MKLLLIEDEADLAQSLVKYLEQEKYLVETADTFRGGLDKIILHDYTCIILDVGLPGGSGLDLLKELKQQKKRDNVIIISAKDSIDDKLLGLELGADDYLTKPFHLSELNARIKAVLRRHSPEGNNTISINNVSLNFISREVIVDETPLILNRKEYDILAYFINNKGRLLQKSMIAEHVWGDQADESDDLEFVYSQIKNLRKKLKEAGAQLEIQAVYGIGYKLVTS